MDRISVTEAELIDELQKAFSSAPPEADGALTAQELVDAMGVNVGEVRRRLRKLHLAGQLEAVKRPDIRIDGRATTVPAYRLKGSNAN